MSYKLSATKGEDGENIHLDTIEFTENDIREVVGALSTCIHTKDTWQAAVLEDGNWLRIDET